MLRNGPPLGETPNTVTCHSADLHVQAETSETKARAPRLLVMGTYNEGCKWDRYDIVKQNKQL